MSDQNARLVELLQAALELEVDERRRFLDEACAGEPDLRAELEATLAWEDRLDGFLEQPAAVEIEEAETTIPERIGNYEILEVLGAGGMGTVYLAEQTHPFSRRVAIKVIRAGRADAGLARRFADEGQALAHMSHANIAQVFDAATTPEGEPFIVMEYVDGCPIGEYCDRNRLGVDARLELVTAVCHGMAHAHQKGIIHLDLKPSNILVAEEQGEPIPKIIDFGIAKALDTPLTGAKPPTGRRQVVGTPAYLSPEALQGLDIDTRADVYAVGLLLYELLAGVLPPPPDLDAGAGSGPTAPSLALAELGDRLEEVAAARGCSPSALSGQLRGELDWITLKALAADRDDRYASVAELGADLDRRSHNEPVTAGPDSRAYRLRKLFARHRASLSAAALAVAALVGGLAATAVSAHRARVEAERANREAETARQVSDFVVGLFEVSQPSEARGNTITAREILDRGAERIEQELASQPLVQARMMGTVGVVYRDLGLYGPARPLLEQALRQRRQFLGDEHLEVADVLVELAVLLYSEGDDDGAEPLLREALATRRRLLGGEDPAVAQVLNILAALLLRKGEHDAAEAMFREALAMNRRLLGDEHPEVVVDLGNLGTLLYTKGDYDHAEPIFREALALNRRLHGDDHPDVAMSLNNLAALLKAKGDKEAAESLHHEALAIRRRIYGDQHPDVAMSLNNLGVLLRENGEYDAAEALLREALAIRRQVLSEEHPGVASSLANLGNVLQDKGDYDGAEALLREALALDRRFRGDRDPQVARHLANLGRLLVTRGDYEPAEAMHKEALAIFERTLPTNHPHVRNAREQYAALLRKVGRTAEAEKLEARAAAPGGN